MVPLRVIKLMLEVSTMTLALRNVT
jgi:hypothetical protein